MSDDEKHPFYPLTDESISRVFSFLSQENLTQLYPYLDYREWPARSIVMDEGAMTDSMGFLVNGRLAVKKASSFPGKKILVAILEQGAMVGELSVLENCCRVATVEAMEDCRMLLLSTDNMEKLLKNEPALATKILRRILHIVSIRMRNLDERLSRLL